MRNSNEMTRKRNKLISHIKQLNYDISLLPLNGTNSQFLLNEKFEVMLDELTSLKELDPSAHASYNNLFYTYRKEVANLNEQYSRIRSKNTSRRQSELREAYDKLQWQIKVDLMNIE